MPLLDMTDAELEQRGARWTVREIAQQPAVWAEALQALAGDLDLRRFIDAQLATPGLRIVLTGAGTSAFIGECLAPAIGAATGLRVEAIATTDIVSGPGLCLAEGVPTLLVSFARSGNSPESVAAVQLADRFVRDCRQLVITCNADGELAREMARRDDARCRAVVLPDASHDRGFAMTSSFTTMLLVAAQCFGVAPHADALVAAAHRLMPQVPRLCAPWVGRFERVVYLGSNELKGLAREAALKLLELSDGRIVSLFDSPLGFRHGPKTIVNGATLVVILLSSDPYTRKYDLDLLRELRADGRAGQVLAIGALGEDLQADGDTLDLPGAQGLTDLELAPLHVLFAQWFALQQSLALGLTPDSPSVSGTVNRVVKGVTIHPVP
ncbi:MAG: SIS domain-containing protein [Comamonadaceae bacterium]|nr:SIS domain-containing protein [Comamonadaceae bacterium]